MTTTERPSAKATRTRSRGKASTVAAPPPASTPNVASPLTDFDLYLFNEGTHVHIYQKLGAHIVNTEDGRSGVFFGVWAPNAEAVSVIGDFNSWDPEATP